MIERIKKKMSFSTLTLTFISVFFILSGVLVTSSFLTRFSPDKKLEANTVSDITIIRIEALITGVMIGVYGLFKKYKKEKVTRLFQRLKEFKPDKRQTAIILLSIVILGLILRVTYLGEESLWYDESVSVHIAKCPSFSSFLSAVKETGVGQPLLYHSLLRGWVEIFGDREVSVRFPSVLFSLLSIPLIFIVGRGLFDERIGLLASFIFSISSFQIRFAQEARSYAMLCLFSLLSIFYFFKVLKEGRLKNWVIYTFINIGLLYTHYLGIFVLLFETLYLLLFWKTYKSKIWTSLLCNLIVFISFLTWLYLSRESILSGINNPADPFFCAVPGKPHLLGLYGILSSFLDYYVLGGWFFIGISIFGIYQSLKREKESKEPVTFLCLWLTTPILWLFIFSCILVFLFGALRYVIVASVAYYILVSNGIIQLKKGQFQLFVIWIIICMEVVNLNYYYFSHQKQEWREVTRYIEQNITSDDLVLLEDQMKYPFNYYYKGKGEVIRLPFTFDRLKNEEFYQTVKPKLNDKDIWLASTTDFHKSKDFETFCKEKLSENYEKISEKFFVGLKVTHLLKK